MDKIFEKYGKIRARENPYSGIFYEVPVNYTFHVSHWCISHSNFTARNNPSKRSNDQHLLKENNNYS